MTGALEGTVRIRCLKCRQNVVFDVATAKVVTELMPRAGEDELFCERCAEWIAGSLITGLGRIRIPCTRRGCKHGNPLTIAEAPVA